MSGVSPEQEKGMISRFWTWFFRSRTLQFPLIVLLLLAFGAFVGVLVSECAEKCISKLLGLCEKNETLKFLGISMGGILVALQVLMSYERAKAMEKTANAQVKATKEQAKANKNTEQGQRQERLKNAIEHLGHESDSVRIGGAYELLHLAKDDLAKDAPEEDTKEKLSQTVLDILCAHIRQTTGKNKYQKKYRSKPSEEVQNLLALMFVQEHKVFSGCHINLQGSWLNGAYLRGARLEKAFLRGAYLQKADLINARLQEAVLPNANLQGAELDGAHLQGAKLHRVHLQGATFSYVHLQGADLSGAHLQGTNLGDVRLQGAKLDHANLQGADLSGAHLQGTILSGVRLQGAKLLNTNLQGADLSGTRMQGVRCVTLLPRAFEERIKMSIGQKADLSEVVFAGRLTREAVDSLVKDLPDEKAKKLREKLASHIGQPESNQLPKDSYAITDSYTEEEAEKWIAEYEQAMSEVPEDDS